jgi:hypothetical protein
MTDVTAGITLAAAEALASQQTFTRPQVAYLLALALDQRRTADLAETIATWQDHAVTPPTREQRVADRLAEMERRSGPPRYHGGPVDYETGRPFRTLGVAA